MKQFDAGKLSYTPPRPPQPPTGHGLASFTSPAPRSWNINSSFGGRQTEYTMKKFAFEMLSDINRGLTLLWLPKLYVYCES